MKQQLHTFSKLTLLVILLCTTSINALAQMSTPKQTPNGSDWVDGSGGVISTSEELVWLSQHSVAWDENWKLIADISFDADETDVDWDGDNNTGDTKGFFSIGNETVQFTGSFKGYSTDGNTKATHSISNLYIYRETESHIGLFGHTDNSFIENISLVNITIVGKDNVGGLAGSITSTSISNIHTSGTITALGNCVGGLIGKSTISSTKNNHSSCLVTGNGSDVGGLVGRLYRSYISNSYSSGAVTGNGDNVGGLVGNVTTMASTDHSYSSGSVTSRGDNIGGLVGTVKDSHIGNCYSTSSVVGVKYVGGLIGYSISESSVENCYSIGSVKGKKLKVGGLIGYADHSSTDCYWDTQKSNQSTSKAGEGKTTSEMGYIISYNNWTIVKDETLVQGAPPVFMIDEDGNYTWIMKPFIISEEKR